ncbi:MAG: VCBS repeat-containing protein [Phycisphaeraceae bacterium]|nr:VCBS repeat-containing protein [Phycisphaeraceae bacterium]
MRTTDPDLTRRRFIGIAAGAAAMTVLPAHSRKAADMETGFPRFTVHEIARIGNKLGQTSLVDIDRDGRLEYLVGARNGSAWWFKYRDADRWDRHLIGERTSTDVGGTAFDVDGDGWIDHVASGTWYRNSGRPADRGFTRHTNGVPSGHDNVAADIDGNGRLDLVVMSRRLAWYRIPEDPTRNWIETDIGPAVHGGIAPRGVGDIDGDGDLDIVRSNGWYENVDGKGTRWRWHENIPGGRPGGRYPLTTRAWVVDFNGNGHMDIVMTDCDLDSPNGSAYWLENVEGDGSRWVRHDIATGKGDLHSLVVADFDGDGQLEVFSGEGPMGGSGPVHAKRWFIWKCTDERRTRWTEHIILEGPECHEAVAGDLDDDGDIDIIAKPWNGDQHLFLQNRLRDPA